MPGIIGNPLTALTARILFDNVEVGTLQELNVEEDFHVQPVNQIGNNMPAVFLPGVHTGRIIASRALLDGDLFFDKLTPYLVPNSEMEGYIRSDIEDGEMQLNKPQQDVEKVYDWFDALFSGKTLTDRATFVVYFDVELINPDDKIFAKYKNCCLTARSLSVTIGNIVVMQNVTMLFQTRSI